MAYFLKNNNEDQNQSGNQNQMSGGNIYSTSGSEVSTPTSTSSNSSSNSSQSNESGNWINLNKYLDANQGKVSSYVDNLVKPYSDSASQFKNDKESSANSYSQNIKNNQLQANKATDIVQRYANDGTSITDDEYKLVSNAVTGNFGVNPYQQTEEYTKLSNTASELGDIGEKLKNKSFQENLMGNNVSSGGKKLNSFLISGTQAGNDKISDYSNSFSELASLLDSQTRDLNKQRNSAIEQNRNTATGIIEAQKANTSPVYNHYSAELDKRYDYNDKRPKNTNTRYYTNMYVNDVPLDVPVVSRFNWTGNTYETEEKEYFDRLNSLLSGSGRQDTKFDDYYTQMSDQDFDRAYTRSKEIQNMLQLPYEKVDSLPYRDRMIIEKFANSFAPWATPVDKQRGSEVYLAYLNGQLNSMDEIYQALYS